MKKTIGLVVLSTLLSQTLWATSSANKIKLLKDPHNQRMQSVTKQDAMSLDRLENMFTMDSKAPGFYAMLKRATFHHKQKAVPLLIKVMKDSKYPEKNRWHATFFLGQIMGRKSAPFIAKFSDHPHWMMRVASLKALMALKQDQYHAVYSKALRDPSLIVRVQALDNISQMNIKPLAPHVWAMLYDKSNYVGEAGKLKRTSIVKSIIRTVGDLEFEKAEKPLAKLIQKPKYNDLVKELDYSLSKITGKNSPKSSDSARRSFWASHSVQKPKL